MRKLLLEILIGLALFFTATTAHADVTPKMVQDTRDQVSNCWTLPLLVDTYNIIETHITTDESGTVTKLTIKSDKVFHPAEISAVKEAVKCAGPLPLKDMDFILDFDNGMSPDPDYEIVMFVIAIIK